MDFLFYFLFKLIIQSTDILKNIDITLCVIKINGILISKKIHIQIKYIRLLISIYIISLERALVDI